MSAHVKINEIWSTYNNRFFVYTEDPNSASILELSYQLNPVAFYRKGDKCVGWQYDCPKNLAEKFARTNNLKIADGTLPKLSKLDRAIVDEKAFKSEE